MQELFNKSLTDRELLLLIADRLERYHSDINAMSLDLTSFKAETRRDIQELRNKSIEQRGFLSGLNWMKTILFTLPPATVAFFFGRDF